VSRPKKLALVTGASRGIGQEIALRLAGDGIDVVLVSRPSEELERTRQECAAAGVKAEAWPLDQGDKAALEKGIAEGIQKIGKVDYLVNNAGVTRDGLLMRMSEEDWDTVLDTNLKGAFLFTKAFARTFIKQRSGRVINVASIIGLIGNAGQCNYAASKAALIGFTKSVARELASRGITVNALAPGFIETDMTAAVNEQLRRELLERIPLNSFGQAEDIANAALFLASSAARYITGQVLTVDGGMVM